MQITSTLKSVKTNLQYLSLLIALLISGKAAAAPMPSDTVGIVQLNQFTPPPNQLGKSGYIALTHQRQEMNLCVPTSASMVLEYFGCPITPRELKVLSRKKKYDPTKEFKDFTFTMFNDLVFGMSKLGINWKINNYQNTRSGANSGLADIKASIDKGNPVLIDTSIYKGHTFVVCGYNNEAQDLIVIDPNIDAPGIRVISYKVVEQIWNSRCVGYNGRGAIFTDRKF